MQTFTFDLRDLNQSQDDSKIGLMRRLETSRMMPSIARTADGQYTIALESIARGDSILKLLNATERMLAEMQVTGDVISGAFSEDGQFFAFSEIKGDRANPVNTLTIYDISKGRFDVHKEVPADQLDDDRRSIYFSSDTVNPTLVSVGEKVVFFSNTTGVREDISSQALPLNVSRIHDAVLIGDRRIFVKYEDANNPGLCAYQIAALPDGIHVEGRAGRNHLRDTTQVGMSQDGQYLYTFDVRKQGEKYEHGIALFDPGSGLSVSYYSLYSTEALGPYEKKEFLAACSKKNEQFVCIYREGDVKTLAVFEINSEGELICKALKDRSGIIDCGLIYSPTHPKMFVTYSTKYSFDGDREMPTIYSRIGYWDARDPENSVMFDYGHYDDALVPSLLIADHNTLLVQFIILTEGDRTLEGTYKYGLSMIPALPVHRAEAGKAPFFQEARAEGALEDKMGNLKLGS